MVISQYHFFQGLCAVEVYTQWQSFKVLINEKCCNEI